MKKGEIARSADYFAAIRDCNVITVAFKGINVTFQNITKLKT